MTEIQTGEEFIIIIEELITIVEDTITECNADQTNIKRVNIAEKQK